MMRAHVFAVLYRHQHNTFVNCIPWNSLYILWKCFQYICKNELISFVILLLFTLFMSELKQLLFQSVKKHITGYKLLYWIDYNMLNSSKNFIQHCYYCCCYYSAYICLPMDWNSEYFLTCGTTRRTWNIFVAEHLPAQNITRQWHVDPHPVWNAMVVLHSATWTGRCGRLRYRPEYRCSTPH